MFHRLSDAFHVGSYIFGGGCKPINILLIESRMKEEEFYYFFTVRTQGILDTMLLTTTSHQLRRFSFQMMGVYEICAIIFFFFS